jgi:hypothetical protein
MKKNKLSPKVAQLALEVGGSHYPEVGGQLLQKFADAMISEFLSTLEDIKTQDNKNTIEQAKKTLIEKFNC